MLSYFKTVAGNMYPSSEDPDEMQHNAGFHLGLHCLQCTDVLNSGQQQINGSSQGYNL